MAPKMAHKSCFGCILIRYLNGCNMKDSIKQQIIREFIEKNDIDIYAMSEINVNNNFLRQGHHN